MTNKTSMKRAQSAEFRRALGAAICLLDTEEKLSSCPSNQIRMRKRLENERERLYRTLFPGGMRARAADALRFNVLVAAEKAQAKSSIHLSSTDLAESTEVRAVIVKRQTDSRQQMREHQVVSTDHLKRIILGDK